MANIICPKCQHVRPADAAVPAWQCPACGVAYAKANAAAMPSATPALLGASRPSQDRQGLPWRVILTVLAIVVGIFAGHQAHLDKSGGSSSAEAGMDEAAVRRLAASVRAEQVVMYSTTECGYCTQARSWLNGYGFAFTECNMSLDSRCVDEFHALKGEGTPYLVVRGPRGEHHMKEGFDSDEFLSALSS